MKKLLKKSKGNIFLLFFAFCIIQVGTFAQDVITLKTGDEIQALVQEIGAEDVKYKKYENPNGPNYTIKKSGIFMIRYANGSKDVFTDNTALVTKTPSNTPVSTNQQNVQSQTNYQQSTAMPLLTDQRFNKGTKSVREVRDLLRDFEIRMKNNGFDKRIVVYDFMEESVYKNMLKNSQLHTVSVGIWVNYHKRLIALRLDKDSWNEIVIPFNDLHSVEILRDGYIVASEGFFGTVRANERTTELYVRVVAGNTRIGAKSYTLKIHTDGGYITKSHPNHTGYWECAKSIVDEIGFIMNNSR